MPVVGQETFARNIIEFNNKFRRHVKKVISGAVEMLDEKVTENMSSTCHTQEDLDMMGNPYGRGYKPGRMPIPHDPYWIVHTQTGQLLRSKKTGVDDVDITAGKMRGRGWIVLDQAVAPYAQDIIWGTSVMIPRDFMTGTLQDTALQGRIKEFMRSNLRDMVVNFKGTRTR